MRIAVLTPHPDRPHIRALCAALRDAGHAADARPPGPDAWADAEAVLADSAALDALPPHAGGAPVAAWLSTPPKALPQCLAAAIATDEAGLEAARRSGLDAARIHCLPLGVEETPRSEAPLAEDCLLWACGDAETILRAVQRLTDLPWRIAGPAMGHAALDRVVADSSPDGGAQASALVLAQQGDSLADDALLLDAALARGLPVALAGEDALQRRVPVAAGVIAAQGDHNALSLALRRVICDVALRRSMAEAAWSHGRALPRRAPQAARIAAVLESLR